MLPSNKNLASHPLLYWKEPVPNQSTHKVYSKIKASKPHLALPPKTYSHSIFFAQFSVEHTLYLANFNSLLPIAYLVTRVSLKAISIYKAPPFSHNPVNKCP